MFPSLKAIDRVAPIGDIPPQSIGSGATISSGWSPSYLFGQIQAIIQTGAIAAGGSVTAQLYQATSAAGAGAKVLTGKATSTALTNAANPTDTVVEINVKGEEFDVTNGFAYVQLQITSTGAASLASGLILGHDPRELPATLNAAANVVQQIG